ncbi:MAG: hypothetical protein AABZ06_03475, partial [Bdellovibrionota bacterium]
MIKRLAISGVGLILLVSPLLASALTVQEQIQALQAQLQLLLAQLATLSAETSVNTGASSGSVSSGAATSCLSITNFLSAGDN